MNNSVAYLILAVTDRCNLNCVYCYRSACEKGGDMSAEVVAEALEAVDHPGPAHVQVTGGEPLLVPGTVRLVGELAGKLKRRPRLAIQTNGTLLTPEIAEMLKEYNFQVGISMDGPPGIQETLRGKAAETLRGLKLLESMGVEFRVTVVLSRENIDSLAQLALLLAGFPNSRGIGLDMLVKRGRAENMAHLPSRSELEAGVGSLLDTLAFINRHRTVPLQLREADHLTRHKGHFCYAAVGRSLAVSPSGSLYPCGQTMGDPCFELGAIGAPHKGEATPLETLTLFSDECRECPLEGQCPGECPSRLHYNRDKGRLLACSLYTFINQWLNNRWN